MTGIVRGRQMAKQKTITWAKSVLEKVRGRSLDRAERIDLVHDLSEWMVSESFRIQSKEETELQTQLAGMMQDLKGKAFVSSMSDRFFRCQSSLKRSVLIQSLLQHYGVPKFLNWQRRLALWSFSKSPSWLAKMTVSFAEKMLRKEMSRVILPGESADLSIHMEACRKEGIRVNLNRLGEAVLGEKEAERRLNWYLEDLKSPNVEYISVKLSTLYSQISLLAWEDAEQVLSERLRELYRTAASSEFVAADGSRRPKFVNLDMEEYKDLQITVGLFRKVLDEPEFLNYQAGIVLQAYLPDAHLIQQSLTVWAMQRVALGGAPIKIRIVKGANLAMEQVEASVQGWAQAPYYNKVEVDANYKRMLTYASIPQHAKAAHIGVASHNLFDIAYALIIRSENKVESFIEMEMLEGMADGTRRVVQNLSRGMLLYCPAAMKEDFHNAIAYLIRRLDENTGEGNFLRDLFYLKPGSKVWKKQWELFRRSYDLMDSVGLSPNRTQNRLVERWEHDPMSSFENEPSTDWALLANQKWVQDIVKTWLDREVLPIPLLIAGKPYYDNRVHAYGVDPSEEGRKFYTYALASKEDVEEALSHAVFAAKVWSSRTVDERSAILQSIADAVRYARGELIGAMMADAGKIATEADVEISEAIDFAEYYRRNFVDWSHLEGIEWQGGKVVVVTPPWNFPCAIPLGGILASLMVGNSVIFKPAPETVLVAWEIANICWDAGVPRDVLQFIPCEDEPMGSLLIQDPRVDRVILTGATSTAKKFLKMRPDLALLAETGGKNTMIVTAHADKDLAVQSIIESAFGHSGQKCSAVSLVICEKEVYENANFREALIDAAQSLHVGSAWDLSTKVNPLIHSPGEDLYRGLTTLEEGEKWLLKPRQDPSNSQLWFPGIKLGVKPGSFMHKTELFGPVIGLVQAQGLKAAIRIANDTDYGLTAGLQSLDFKEQEYWLEHLEAGNLYINRGITGAIVQRQAFGGCKASSFGRGAKAGGPNYLTQLADPVEVHSPKAFDHLDSSLETFLDYLDTKLSAQEHTFIRHSAFSYTEQWNSYFSRQHDPSLLQGQDNFLEYRLRKNMALRVTFDTRRKDLLRVLMAIMVLRLPITVSYDSRAKEKFQLMKLKKYCAQGTWVEQENDEWEKALKNSQWRFVRYLRAPSEKEFTIAAESGVQFLKDPVLSHGRLELLNYLREVSISIDYHRYGNLGDREGEERTPIVAGASKKKLDEIFDTLVKRKKHAPKK